MGSEGGELPTTRPGHPAAHHRLHEHDARADAVDDGRAEALGEPTAHLRHAGAAQHDRVDALVGEELGGHVTDELLSAVLQTEDRNLAGRHLEAGAAEAVEVHEVPGAPDGALEGRDDGEAAPHEEGHVEAGLGDADDRAALGHLAGGVHARVAEAGQDEAVRAHLHATGDLTQHAGRYDGIMGVLLVIAVVARLAPRAMAGTWDEALLDLTDPEGSPCARPSRPSGWTRSGLATSPAAPRTSSATSRPTSSRDRPSRPRTCRWAP